MAKKSTIEHEPFIRVASMTPESARDFVTREFEIDPARVYRIDDAGPADQKYKPGAREWHVYISGKPVGGHLFRVKENPLRKRAIYQKDRPLMLVTGMRAIEAARRGAKLFFHDPWGKWIPSTLARAERVIRWAQTSDWMNDEREKLGVDRVIKIGVKDFGAFVPQQGGLRLENPYTPPSELWPRYEYRLKTRPGDKPWLVDVFLLERRPGEKPLQKRVSAGNHTYIQAIDVANDHAKIKSMAEPNNPNPTIVLDNRGSCYSAFVGGKRTHCPDEMVRRNPYTPPSTQWPVFEVRIRYDKRSESWKLLTLKKAPGENPKIEEDFMGYVQRGQALGTIRIRAELLSMRPSGDLAYGAPEDPRNPNAVRVLDERGRCVTAFLAGNEIGCSNPVSSILPPDVVEAFTKLGSAQRGAPETAMLNAQLAMGGGVMNPLVEHVGDLIHRMTHNVRHDYHGYAEVKGKVEDSLRWLRNEYGFGREMRENFHNNARARGIPFDEYMNRVQESLQAYTEAHEKLPAYNTAQWLARQAAIEVGRMDSVGAEVFLERLHQMMRTREQWQEAAFAYARGPNGKLLVSVWPAPPVHA